ncbi:MAG: hydrogenase nickel incorporation protein HypB [Methylococcaceae bacterium]|nr:hydrogenase nickel incorporation protein HypB [Methylococcaceae bacterium]
MCDTCGCNITPGNRHLLTPPVASMGNSPEKILGSLLQHNDRQAELNRARLDRHGVLTINLMSSPGSGKTALLESTIRKLAGGLRIAVIEGDLETENDADRIRALGVPAHQITTGTACHLDAHLVEKALDHLALENLDLLFIENVGNLVCPASFDLGHHRNVALLSVTEGDDKPAKYPVMFRAADLMLISKSDLLPYLPEFSPPRAESCLRDLASDSPALRLSAKNGEGMEQWIGWLEGELRRYRELRQNQQTLSPRIQPEGRQRHGASPEIKFIPVHRNARA